MRRSKRRGLADDGAEAAPASQHEPHDDGGIPAAMNVGMRVQAQANGKTFAAEVVSLGQDSYTVKALKPTVGAAPAEHSYAFGDSNVTPAHQLRAKKQRKTCACPLSGQCPNGGRLFSVSQHLIISRSLSLSNL